MSKLLITVILLQGSIKFATIPTMEKTIDKLKELGFNSYEAKVYLALLKKYPATGYEVAQTADIPQARAYDALKSLVAESFVFSDQEKPQKYTPISPKELTRRFKRKVNSTLEYLEKKLPSVREDYNEPIHTISGYENIIEKLREVINNAKESMYCEFWQSDYKQLEPEIMNAYDRGVDIKIVGYDKIVGLSTTNEKQAEEAIHTSADYIGIGPIFSTNTNPWWVLSNAAGGMGSAYVLYNYGGYAVSNQSADLRPTLYLKSEVKLSGSGTQSDPYVVS